MKTKVTLVSWTQNPIETVYYLWEAARNNEKIINSPEDIKKLSNLSKEYKQKVRSTFEKVVDSSIPIAENINFTFLIEGVSISWREQAVRHKIGVKVGERLGVDMFPDIHDSTFWIQSMRVLDMGKFAQDDLFRMPESVASHPDPLVRETYIEHMHQSAGDYAFLLNQGVPIEDAREVIPLGAQHRLSWTLNMSALIHIAKKRSCTVPQIGTWGPVIQGMIKELTEKVDPYFSKIVTPPCISGEKFNKCLYELDNERRILREDPLMPCFLLMAQKGIDPKTINMDHEKFNKWEKEYEEFWQRDTKTGKRKVEMDSGNK